MKKPVLIVVDMLRDFLDSWEPDRRTELVESINQLVGRMRSLGRPVVWVRQEFEPDLRDAFPEMKEKGIRVTIRGTAGCEFIADVAIDPADLIIVKKRYSAFFATNLQEVLTRLQPDTVILAGINTHACIRTTAIDAYQHDWSVIVAADCVDSYDREHHDISLRYIKDKIAAVMSNAEIFALLNPAP
jgi:nicotinamidase-related amidase